MKWLISVLMIFFVDAIQLRGMFQKKREQLIHDTSSQYFLEIYKDVVSLAALSEKYTNYSFYEYGYLPLSSGMVEKKYMAHNMEMCDVHQENIQYYTTIAIKNMDEKQSMYPCDDMYLQRLIPLVKLNYDLRHYQIENNEITSQVLKKINNTFIDIHINKTITNCCYEYTIVW